MTAQTRRVTTAHGAASGAGVALAVVFARDYDLRIVDRNGEGLEVITGCEGSAAGPANYLLVKLIALGLSPSSGAL